MACYDRRKAWLVTDQKTGKQRLSFKMPRETRHHDMEVRCNQCVGCRLDYSRDWAIRIMHEAAGHTRNCFITLTYDDEHLPWGANLRKPDVQKFLKRLRRRTGLELRYFLCGEYGDKHGRPHYHIALFGYDFPDKYFWKKSHAGYPLHMSDLLDELWPFGHADIGALTFESAAYVARYILKKQNGKNSRLKYSTLDKHTGEYIPVEGNPQKTLVREKEYCSMSLKPGLGTNWIEEYFDEVYPAGSVVFKGREYPAPRFYDLKLKERDPTAYEELMEKRSEQLKPENETPERRKARKRFKERQVQSLKRNI